MRALCRFWELGRCGADHLAENLGDEYGLATMLLLDWQEYYFDSCYPYRTLASSLFVSERRYSHMERGKQKCVYI